MATLMAMILCLIGIDVTTQYNCEVRVFRVYFICTHALIGYDPKVETVFQLVSSSHNSPDL
jgi:hypothetical protein